VDLQKRCRHFSFRTNILSKIVFSGESHGNTPDVLPHTRKFSRNYVPPANIA
jgi:hypothetical protein